MYQWLLPKEVDKYWFFSAQSFEVCDLDFTRFSAIPTVLLKIDIPTTMDGSWYEGQVYVGLFLSHQLLLDMQLSCIMPS